MSSLEHLSQHHGSFEAFRDAMVSSTDGRFNDIWWGIWSHYIDPLQPQSILDLGTGPALFLPKLRLRYPKAEITGVEVQPVMLETARTVCASCNAQLIEADLASPLPIADESMDVITAVMVLHELLFPPTMLSEAARILKPGGRMVVYDWIKRPLRAYLGDAELTEDKLNHYREHCLYAADDIVFLAEQAGLTQMEYIGRRSGHFAIFVFEKKESE